MALRRRYRLAVLAAHGQGARLRSADRGEDVRRSSSIPNLVNQLRDTPAEDLIPRGYGTPPPIPLIFESGGTTGAPKRTAQLPDWVAQVVDWQTDDFRRPGFVGGRGFLCLMPSGPHGVGHFSRVVSARLGSIVIWSTSIPGGSRNSSRAAPRQRCRPI